MPDQGQGKGQGSGQVRNPYKFKQLEEHLGKVHLCDIQVIAPDDPLEGPLNGFRRDNILMNLEAGNRAAQRFLERGGAGS